MNQRKLFEEIRQENIDLAYDLVKVAEQYYNIVDASSYSFDELADKMATIELENYYG